MFCFIVAAAFFQRKPAYIISCLSTISKEQKYIQFKEKCFFKKENIKQSIYFNTLLYCYIVAAFRVLLYQYISKKLSIAINCLSLIACIVFNFNKIPNQHLASLFCKSLPCCQPFIYTIFCASYFMSNQGSNHCFAIRKF